MYLKGHLQCILSFVLHGSLTTLAVWSVQCPLSLASYWETELEDN